MAQARGHKGARADALYEQAGEKYAAAEALVPGAASYNLACLAGLRGDAVEAARLLICSKELGVIWPGCDHVNGDADFAKVRHAPEFVAALARTGCA